MIMRRFAVFVCAYFLISICGNSSFIYSQSTRTIAQIDSLILQMNRELPLVTPASYFEKKSSAYNSKSFSDSFFKEKLDAMAQQTPIHYEYNADVRKYIDLYLGKRRPDFERMLGLAQLYFPIFDEYLDKYKLPLELKYLAVIESGLNPLAVSSSGATGLWQFKLNTSVMFGLNITSYIDERCDVLKSTETACHYMQYLYHIFNDWQLALAAYNGGPGEVRNAIIRSGGKMNFWELQPYLPEQTRWYVPAFMAASYVMLHPAEHELHAKIPPIYYSEIDTVGVNKYIELQTIASKLNVSYELLKMLNPTYRRFVIPESKTGLVLVLPANKVSEFVRKESNLNGKHTIVPNYLQLVENAGDTVGRTRVRYAAESGDFLHKIAFKFSCTPDNLRAWNHLSTDQVNHGQVLDIWVYPEVLMQLKLDTTNVSSHKSSVKSNGTYYIVQKGETPYTIATKYNIKVNDFYKINKLRKGAKLAPGQRVLLHK